MRLLKPKEEVVVVKHGHMATEVNYITCPECFEVISDNAKISTKKGVLAETKSFNEYYDVIKYRCESCGCEFEKKILKKRSFSWQKNRNKILIFGIVLSVLGFIPVCLLPSSLSKSILTAILWIILILSVGLWGFFAPWSKGKNKVFIGLLAGAAIGTVVGLFLKSFTVTNDLGFTFLLLSLLVFLITLLIWIIITVMSES